MSSTVAEVRPDADVGHILTQLTRLGAAIDKELSLINERMTWLVISESFIFSGFTMAVGTHEKQTVLGLLVGILPLVGLLMALFVYPALLAAHNTANRLKGDRRRFELRLPENLRIDMLASRRAHLFGSIPAFLIPLMLILVWITIIVSLVYMPWK
jgi:hypothetical protein